MATLLERAQAHLPRRNPRHEVTDEEIELAIAVIEGRVSMAQAVRAFGLNHNHTAARLFKAIIAAYDRGLLTIQK